MVSASNIDTVTHTSSTSLLVTSDPTDELHESSYSSNTNPVITGEIRRFSSLHINVFHDGLPIWVLALRHTDVSSIFVSQLCNSVPSSANHMIYSDWLFSRLSLFNVVNTNIAPSNCTRLDLYSGSVDFLCSTISVTTPYPTLGVVGCHISGRRLPRDTPFPFYQVLHSRVGGATAFRTLYCQFNLPSTSLRSPLSRSLQGYIRHSHPGQSCIGPTSNALLLPDKLGMPYVDHTFTYATHASRTGFARRPLSDDELLDTFNLPISLSLSMPRDIYLHCVPGLILTTLLTGFFATLPSVPIQRKVVHSHVSFTPASSDSHESDLPELNCKLSHAWAKSDTWTGDGAHKHDDAEADLAKWELRIYEPFPWLTPRALRGFRMFLLLYARRKLVREFLQILRGPYKDTFYSSYFTFRSQRMRLAVQRSNIRLLVELQGGNTPLPYGMTSRPPTLLPVQDAIEFSCPPRSFTSTPCPVMDPSLPLDKMLKAARGIITSFCGTPLSSDSYINWNSGSTLIFWRWPVYLQRYALMGIPPFIKEKLPENKRKPRPVPAHVKKLIAEKIARPIQRGYIELCDRNDV